MILNVSHITLNCSDIARSTQALVLAGFQPKFVHASLPNVREKKPFLRNHTTTHAISFCRSLTGLPIELCDHQSIETSSISGGYWPLFRRRLQGSKDLGNGANERVSDHLEVWQSALGKSVQSAFWEPFQTPYVYETAPALDSTSIQGLLLKTGDLSHSVKFWCDGIGCQLIRRGRGLCGKWAHLVFSTPVSSDRLNLVLLQSSEESVAPCMDDPGFPCLAFLVSGLDHVNGRLLTAGASASGEAFHFQAGGRFLRGRLLRGPDQELIELIEFQRDRVIA